MCLVQLDLVLQSDNLVVPALVELVPKIVDFEAPSLVIRELLLRLRGHQTVEGFDLEAALRNQSFIDL